MAIESYRRTVSPENAELYLGCLREALGEVDASKFDFVGYFVSATEQGKTAHDVDVLTKLKGRKVGEEAKEFFKLHGVASEKYAKIGGNHIAVPCPEKAQQEFYNYVVDPEYSNKNLIPIHALITIDSADLEHNFPFEFKNSLSSTVRTLYGNLDNLFNSPSRLIQPQKEPLYWVIKYMLDSRIENLPSRFALESAESVFEYLKKNYPQLEVEEIIPRDVDEARLMNEGIMKSIDNWLYRTDGTMGVA